MPDPVVESLILDLLEWLGKQNRIYEETMDAWRTSCPKLPVWEDATDRGLVSMDLAQDGIWFALRRRASPYSNSVAFRGCNNGCEWEQHDLGNGGLNLACPHSGRNISSDQARHLVC
jgi:hypothetical protein